MAFIVFNIFVWLLIISLGANIFQTFIIYPNIFHNIPTSLGAFTEFMTIQKVIDFFPPLGFVTLILGIAVSILTWRISIKRYWMIGGPVILLLCEFIFSATLLWPKNTIMFSEGIAMHSDNVLKETAQHFQFDQWIRMSMNGVAAVIAFLGLLNLYRFILTKERININ